MRGGRDVASIEQLAITRAAIVYLARTIDINEALIARDDEQAGKLRAPLTFPPVASDLARSARWLLLGFL
jgi:hypothetical protein